MCLFFQGHLRENWISVEILDLFECLTLFHPTSVVLAFAQLYIICFSVLWITTQGTVTVIRHPFDFWYWLKPTIKWKGPSLMNRMILQEENYCTDLRKYDSGDLKQPLNLRCGCWARSNSACEQLTIKVSCELPCDLQFVHLAWQRSTWGRSMPPVLIFESWSVVMCLGQRVTVFCAVRFCALSYQKVF